MRPRLTLFRCMVPSSKAFHVRNIYALPALLRYRDLSNNPLSCDCDFRWLVELVIATPPELTLLQNAITVCAWPPELKGRTVSSLTTNLNCSKNSTHVAVKRQKLSHVYQMSSSLPHQHTCLLYSPVHKMPPSLVTVTLCWAAVSLARPFLR